MIVQTYAHWGYSIAVITEDFESLNSGSIPLIPLKSRIKNLKSRRRPNQSKMLRVLRLMAVDARTHNPILTHFTVRISPRSPITVLAD